MQIETFNFTRHERISWCILRKKKLIDIDPVLRSRGTTTKLTCSLAYLHFPRRQKVLNLTSHQLTLLHLMQRLNRPLNKPAWSLPKCARFQENKHSWKSFSPNRHQRRFRRTRIFAYLNGLFNMAEENCSETKHFCLFRNFHLHVRGW
jgi:hypothetical protein